MKLSIILNTHNHPETAQKYLPAMLTSSGVEHQLLIHDNGSKDTSWLDQYNPILSPENIGNPSGLNKLLPLCTGEYIAKIDPDFIMPKDWAAKAIDLIESLPNIGLVGFFWGRGLIHPDLQKGPHEIHGEHIIFVPNKVFGCWVFHRSLIEKVGHFYDKWKYGNWDSEFNDRVKRNGYRNVYHRNDSIHMGTDTPAERRLKNIWRSKKVEIPEMFKYTEGFDYESFCRNSHDHSAT